MDDGLCLESDPTLLVPLVVDLDPMFQFGARFSGTCGAGRFEVDGVQSLLGETRVLRKRGEELLHHRTRTSSGLSAQGQGAAVRWRVAALVAVVCGGGGLAYSGAAVHAGAQRVAADAVLAGAEAGAGSSGRGDFADRAAGALQTAGRHRVCAHQSGRKLAGVVWQVHVYGCCGDDTGRIGDPQIYKIKHRNM